MKKLLTIAISLLAVSAFAAGVVFKANPLALLQSGGGGDDKKAAKVEQTATNNVQQATTTTTNTENLKEKVSGLLSAKRAAKSADEVTRINAQLVKCGRIALLTPNEIEAVKKSGYLITHHDTGWQEVAAEQPTNISPEQQRLAKFSKEEISKAPDRAVRVAYDEHGNVIENKTMNRLEYLESPSRFTKEDNIDEQKIKHKK